MSLPRTDFAVDRAKTLQISPSSARLPSGDTILFTALLRDQAGNPIPLTPTLLFDGGFGTINSDGTFFVPPGIGAGSGSITAFWYVLPAQGATVTVDNTLAPKPPPAPMLPVPGGTAKVP